MKSRIIIDDAPSGTESCYNALRAAQALLEQESAEVSLFLMADAIAGRTEGSFFELIAP